MALLLSALCSYPATPFATHRRSRHRASQPVMAALAATSSSGEDGPLRAGEGVAARLPPPKSQRVLSYEEAKAVYDRAGSKIGDSKSAYGRPAIAAMVKQVDLSTSKAVLEFGCGPGDLADLLLQSHLPHDCRYRCVDQSEVMMNLARERLGPYGRRVSYTLSEGDPRLLEEQLQGQSYDVFVSTYVLDLLSDEDVAAVLEMAWRLLVPGGHLLLVGITNGISTRTRIAAGLWGAVHSVAPQLVGGCRPQLLLEYLGDGWTDVQRATVQGGLMPSEIVTGRKPR